MKHFSHLNTAVQLLERYNGEMPFSIFLKSFFSQHSKYGSRDRKRIAHICYCYFRLGLGLRNVSVEDKALIGLFLCSQVPDDLLQHAKPAWHERIEASVDEKIAVLNSSDISFQLEDIFPWTDELSGAIDHNAFCRSFLVQPDLFIRLRPGNEKTVQQKLKYAGVGFEVVSPSCLSLANTSKIDTIIELDREAVVQDINSQRTGTFFDREPKTDSHSKADRGGLSVWDCCAASGGKSILAYDLIPSVKLTVSDIRESIILNLKKRFAKAAITNYHALVIDLGKSNTPNSSFDLIICDAPCSGSGTWSRTPEQLAFFNPAKIDHYANLQRTIASNAVPSLKKGGRFVYITCSVFKKENEATVDFIRDTCSLELERVEVLKGNIH